MISKDEMKKTLMGLFSDGLVLCGIASTAYGAYLIYEPAGYVVAGVILLALGLVGSMKGNR